MKFKVGIDSEMFGVKVPLVFLGTEGFSLRREGRYISSLWILGKC